MNLKKLSKKAIILDGLVTTYFLPYRTRKAGYVFDELVDLFNPAEFNEQGEELERSRSTDNWDNYQFVFLYLEQYLVEMTFKKSDNAFVTGLQHYWQGRNDNLEHNWELFAAVISSEIALVLYGAWNDTREQLPGAPEILQGGKPDQATDPEVSSDGGEQ